MKSLLGNMLAGKRITSARDGIIGAGCESKKKKKLILQLILKYKSIVRINQDLMKFILEMNYLVKLPSKIKDGANVINLMSLLICH